MVARPIAVVSLVGIALVFLVVFSTSEMAGHFHSPGDATNYWVVGIRGEKEEADSLARKYGFHNRGQVSHIVALQSATRVV